MSPSENRLTAIELEEHHVGERSGVLGADEQRYLHALAEERRRFLSEESAQNFFARPAFSSQPVAPARQRGIRFVWPWALGLGVAVAAVLLVSTPLPKTDVVQLRGGGLTVIVARDGKQSRVDETYVARAGDMVRFRVRVVEPGPVVVGFIDGGGHYQELIRQRVDRTGVILLDEALELDKEPIAGWFVAGSVAEIRARLAGASSGIAATVEVRWENR